MEFNNGFLFDVATFRQLPIYISPVTISSAWENKKLFENYKDEVVTSFDGKPALITESATQALLLALQQIGLNKDDEVWILTTTGNTYISACVTDTIREICAWSRVKSERTRAILVNHEFGFAYSNLAELKQFNLPIIEDVAYSMFSQNEQKNVGSVGDYAIYSLAKMFPVQAGGILVNNTKVALPKSVCSAEMSRYFSAVLAQGLKDRKEIISARRRNYSAFEKEFSKLGLPARFELTDADVPGAFLFKGIGINLPNLKKQLQQNGVECSVFYGEESFYIPCHQDLSSIHIEYLVELVKFHIK